MLARSVPPMRPARGAALLVGLAAILSGGCLDHYLIHPGAPPAGIEIWRQELVRGSLRIRLDWASPEGEGPFPAVLVHPEAGKTVEEMRGVVWDLAAHGYVAASADYERLIEGEHRRNLFPWRDEPDVTAAMEAFLDEPGVDRKRAAAIGFSQGGVFSLLIAARTPGLKAVVAYYPVTDFWRWLHPPDPGMRERFILRYFRKSLGSPDDERFRQMVDSASAWNQAERIHAPVLLIHGREDTTASVQESVLMAERLESLGREVKLVIVEGAGHVFNFKDAERAREAWNETLDWLDGHLR